MWSRSAPKQGKTTRVEASAMPENRRISGSRFRGIGSNAPEVYSGELPCRPAGVALDCEARSGVKATALRAWRNR